MHPLSRKLWEAGEGQGRQPESLATMVMLSRLSVGVGGGYFKANQPLARPLEIPPHSGDDYLPRSSLSSSLSQPICPPHERLQVPTQWLTADSAPYQADGANGSQQGVERVRVGVRGERGLLLGSESVCVSGGVIKHSLAMMDVCVGVSEWTLVEAGCGCVSKEFSGWFWVFCTMSGCWLLCGFLTNS